jgi:hypothetical protein
VFGPASAQVRTLKVPVSSAITDCEGMIGLLSPIVAIPHHTYEHSNFAQSLSNLCQLSQNGCWMRFHFSGTFVLFLLPSGMEIRSHRLPFSLALSPVDPRSF